MNKVFDVITRVGQIGYCFIQTMTLQHFFLFLSPQIYNAVETTTILLQLHSLNPAKKSRQHLFCMNKVEQDWVILLISWSLRQHFFF